MKRLKFVCEAPHVQLHKKAEVRPTHQIWKRLTIPISNHMPIVSVLFVYDKYSKQLCFIA